MQKNAKKNVFQSFHFFSPDAAFKQYLTKEVVIHRTFIKYIHLPSKKIWFKNIDKQRR